MAMDMAMAMILSLQIVHMISGEIAAIFASKASPLIMDTKDAILYCHGECRISRFLIRSLQRMSHH